MNENFTTDPETPDERPENTPSAGSTSTGAADAESTKQFIHAALRGDVSSEISSSTETSRDAVESVEQAGVAVAGVYAENTATVIDFATAMASASPTEEPVEADEPEEEPEPPTNEELARSAPKEVKNRAERIAETLFGSKEGSAGMAKDIVASAMREGTETIMDLLDSLSQDVQVIKGERREYQLTTLFLMRPKQLRRAHELLKEIAEEAQSRRHERIGLTFDNVATMLDQDMGDADTDEGRKRRERALKAIPSDIWSWVDAAINSEKVDLLMACLYVPVDRKKFRPDEEELREFAEELADELTVGQRVGAAYRFFTYHRFSIQAAIRRCLGLLTPLLEDRTQKPATR